MKNYLKTTAKFYTVSDISSLLVVDGEAVRKWIREGKLRGIKCRSKKEGMII